MINPEDKAYIDSEAFVEGLECLQREIPWIVPESVYKLDELLSEDDVVLEAGAGGSTLFFARRCRRIVSIETSDIYTKRSPTDKVWSEKVNEYIIKRGIHNTAMIAIPIEDRIIEFIQAYNTEQITVLSVDTQGGYNRGRILNSFLDKGVSSNLRLIVLDNYNHPELFSDDAYMNKLPNWMIMDFKHSRWAGDGTRLIIKP